MIHCREHRPIQHDFKSSSSRSLTWESDRSYSTAIRSSPHQWRHACGRSFSGGNIRTYGKSLARVLPSGQISNPYFDLEDV